VILICSRVILFTAFVDIKMAAFLGTRETMQPRSARPPRGKRGRAKDECEIVETAPADQGSRGTNDVKKETTLDTGITQR